MPRTLANILFDLFIVGTLAAAVLTAAAWPFGTRLFPMTVGIPTLAACLIQLGKDLRRTLRDPAVGESDTKEYIHDIAVDRSIPTPVAVARAAGFLGWVTCFLALILTIGFKAAIPVFLLAYLRLCARTPWWLTLLWIAILMGLVLGVFDRMLNVPWPESLAGRWLPL